MEVKKMARTKQLKLICVFIFVLAMCLFSINTSSVHADQSDVDSIIQIFEENRVGIGVTEEFKTDKNSDNTIKDINVATGLDGDILNVYPKITGVAIYMPNMSRTGHTFCGWDYGYLNSEGEFISCSEPWWHADEENGIEADYSALLSAKTKLTYNLCTCTNPMHKLTKDGALGTDEVLFYHETYFKAIWDDTPEIEMELNIIFNPNDDYTELGLYALSEANLSVPEGAETEFNQNEGMLSKAIGLYSNVGVLPEIAREGYEFLGWYTEPIDGILVTETTIFESTLIENGKVTVYAHWKNLNPSNLVLSAQVGSSIYTASNGMSETLAWSNKPVTITGKARDNGDGIALTELYRERSDQTYYASKNYLDRDGIQTSLVEQFFSNYNVEGTTSFMFAVNDMELVDTGSIDRILEGRAISDTLTVKLDMTAPKITTFTVDINTFENLTQSATTPVANWNGFNLYKASDYGAKINIEVTDENETLYDPTDVSNIKYMWLRIYDTNNYDATNADTLLNSTYRDYELIANEYDEIDVSITESININVDFHNIMNLSYELHIIDMAGNETIETKQIERMPEIVTKAKRTTEDLSLDEDEFLPGYKGELYIYTTGWVDEVELAWPEYIIKAALFDESMNILKMDYNVTLNMIIDSVDTDPNLLYLDAEGETTGFTRCYVFDFWIPFYLTKSVNPDYLNIEANDFAILPIASTATKYIVNDILGEEIIETVIAESNLLIKIGHGSIIDKIRTSILN